MTPDLKSVASDLTPRFFFTTSWRESLKRRKLQFTGADRCGHVRAIFPPLIGCLLHRFTPVSRHFR